MADDARGSGPEPQMIIWALFMMLHVGIATVIIARVVAGLDGPCVLWVLTPSLLWAGLPIYIRSRRKSDRAET